MSTPKLTAFRSAAVLLAVACSACAPQVRDRSAVADGVVPCWADAPPRMRHVDWALSQSGIALDRPAREQMLRVAQRVCAAGAAHADFVLQPGAPPMRDGLVTRAGLP